MIIYKQKYILLIKIELKNINFKFDKIKII